MKKILYILSISALILGSACNSLDDIYEDIDAQESPVVGDAEYTLTDDDYDDLDLSYGNFSSVDDAKSMLPDFLSEKYPVWGKGSSVLVNYELYVGSAPGVSDYTYADDYSLAADDYPKSALGAVGFLPDEDPADYIADILADSIADPEEGQNVLVKYKTQLSSTLNESITVFEENFNGSLGVFEAVNVLGSKDWYSSSYNTDEYAKISAYGNGVNEDWLVSPAIDLSDYTNLVFQVNQTAKYVDDRWDLLNILISTNYSGDVATATWDTIKIETLPAGDDYTFVLSEAYDLSAYEDEIVYIAFKYETTESVAATWEINDVIITSGVEQETVSKEVFYTYNGSKWVEAEGVYFVSDDDFDSMGEAYGQPGYYNNFGSSITPTDYLGTFLTLKYPYAQEDDEIIVVYDYYSSSSGAQLRGNLYTFTDGAWTNYESTQSASLQFGHDGTTWVPDNTIKYTLTSADYTYIGETYADKYSSIIATIITYQDFDSNWTDEYILDVLNGVLFNNFPDAEEGQKFAVTYLMYSGGAQYLTMYVILEGGVYVMQ